MKKLLKNNSTTLITGIFALCTGYFVRTYQDSIVPNYKNSTHYGDVKGHEIRNIKAEDMKYVENGDYNESTTTNNCYEKFQKVFDKNDTIILVKK